MTLKMILTISMMKGTHYLPQLKPQISKSKKHLINNSKNLILKMTE